MALDIDGLQQSLCKGFCHDVRLERRPDGALMLDTFFEFPDGDHYPIHVSEVTGGLRLSDRGHTLMRISYDHDVDAFLAGSRGLLLERILAETGLARNGGAFVFDTTTEQLSEAVFRYGQAMTRIFDLTTLSRSRVSSTFYDDLADLISEMVDQGSVQRHYRPSKVPNAEAYSVDYRIEGNGDPVFLYGVPNRDKARLTTIMLSHFHRHGLAFESLIVFKDQQKIPPADLARLSDVGGEMVSSLESSDDLARKLGRRAGVAA